MGFVKVTRLATNEIIYDSRLEDLSNDGQKIVHAWGKLVARTEGETKIVVDKIREAAIRREAREAEERDILGNKP